MANAFETVSSYGGALSTAERNRVLRNTYGLLALSMIPTVLGAWVGVKFGVMASLGLGLSTIIFFVGAFGLMFAIERTKHSAVGVYLLLAFTFFMGLMLSRLLGSILSLSNGATLIMTAFGGTAAIFAGMATLASVIKRDLSNMSRWLFVGALVIMVAAIANIFFQIPALMLTISVLAIGIFSAFILVDLNRIITGGETNYVSATLAIYLDLYNVFSNLLAVLGIVGGDRD